MLRESAVAKFVPGLQHTELLSLRELSARVGNDPLLVQASNGNTSIKIDGSLWIKASGKWLAHAMHEEMFVRLDLAEVKRFVEAGSELSEFNNGEDEAAPSIETAMHAVLLHRVVIHVHSINTIAWAIRMDGPEQVRERLAGLRWKWIPYAASGIPLAREIEKAVAGVPETDILILGNHGLVVCGRDCESAEKLLKEVEQRLIITPRRVPQPDTEALGTMANSTKWQFPDIDEVHALGTDAVSRKILSGGVLYPCQAIFLGATMPVVPASRVVATFKETRKSRGQRPAFVAVERTGVMLSREMTRTQRATLLGLVQVTQRTEPAAPLRYLKSEEVTDLLTRGTYR
jgi:rhamnose utilization protein RhaD (predicted bifunctional aldolase and dehydrogenase)